MKRYQPIHAEKYRASQPDDFQIMGKLDEDTEAKALAQADYQTRLRVERANIHKK